MEGRVGDLDLPENSPPRGDFGKGRIYFYKDFHSFQSPGRQF